MFVLLFAPAGQKRRRGVLFKSGTGRDIQPAAGKSAEAYDVI